jgi:hypothetical protein
MDFCLPSIQVRDLYYRNRLVSHYEPGYNSKNRSPALPDGWYRLLHNNRMDLNKNYMRKKVFAD